MEGLPGTQVGLLRQQAELAFAGLVHALDGITEFQAWGVLSPAADDYLHTDGSVYGLVLHLAGGKMMYGSTGFRGTEVRWRDLAERLERFEPSWQAALDFLHEAHRYWLASWEDLQDQDLYQDRPHFSGRLWPAWKIIHTVTDHDAYHTGQIVLVRYAALGSSQPPASVAEDVRENCSSLPGW